MNSLKTGVVVVVLLGVLYGVYRVLNMPDQQQFLTNMGLSAQSFEPPVLEPGEPFFPDPEPGELPTEPKPFPPSKNPADDWTPGDPDELPPSNPKPGPTAPDDESTFKSHDSAGVDLDEALSNARALVDTGKPREALEALTFYYDHPDLSAEQRGQLQSWLDPLAGKVIYSVEHHLEQPHVVQQGDTLESIASRYGVPAQLIYNINQDSLSQHDTLLPGVKLKVLRGPFEATVDLQNNRLTLFVNGLYAGHFAVSIGDSPTPRTGQYLVKRKLHPDDQENPIGEWLVDLGSEIAIHGSPSSRGSNYKCIVLDPSDAADVTSILSDGSNIRIRR